MSWTREAEVVAIAVTLAWACASDVRWRLIPNSCVLAVLAAHAAACALEARAGAGVAVLVVRSLAGALAALVPLLVARALVGGVGAGDVKLLGALGASTGPAGALALLALSCVFALSLVGASAARSALVCRARGRAPGGAGRRRGAAGLARTFPMAPAIALAWAALAACRAIL